MYNDNLRPLNTDCTSSMADYINNTDPHTPGEGYLYYKLNILTDTVISDYEPAFGGGTFTGVTIAAGQTITGAFTAITLTSGTLLAYKRKL